MSEPQKPTVAHGDRRQEVWIEDDPNQLSKVRHTWPTRPPPHGQSAASEEGAAADPSMTDAAVVPEEPSAWEAVEDDD